MKAALYLSVSILIALFGFGSSEVQAACASPPGNAGTITWNGTDAVIWCDGSNWNSLGSGGGLSGGTSGYLGVWTGATSLGLSSTAAGQQLFWDVTTHRLGVGTASPFTKLHVQDTRNSHDAATIANLGTSSAHGLRATTNASDGVASIGVNYSSGAYGYLGYATWGVYCSGTYCGGNQVWTSSSDARLKTNVRPLSETDGLATIMALRPVHFKWKDSTREQIDQIGFIAQEVQKILPQVVENPKSEVLITASDGTRETIDDALSMSYATLVAPLVKAVQQLKYENDQLRAQLKAANDNYEGLRSDVDALKKRPK